MQTIVFMFLIQAALSVLQLLAIGFFVTAGVALANKLFKIIPTAKRK